MKKTKDDQSFEKEVRSIIDKISALLEKTQPEEFSHEQVLDLYGLLHQLDEDAGTYGINSIVKITSRIEQMVSEIREEKLNFTVTNSSLISSGTGLILKLLDDPKIEDAPLRVSYENLLKEVDNEIKKGGSERDTADDGMLYNNKFQEVFIEEASDLINQLEEKMLQLESEPSDNKLVDDVFRIMHTLKGNSNMFGYEFLGEITHHLENVYDDIRSSKLENGRKILEITLLCIDHFRALLDDPQLQNSKNKELQEEIMQGLNEITNTSSSADKKQDKKNKSAEAGHTYYLFFKPQTDVFDDGTNPLYFVYDLHEIGDCIIVPNYDSIPADDSFDHLKCYTLWHILIFSKEPIDAIREHFMFLKEESQPVVRELSEENLIKNKKFKAWFEEQSKLTTPLPENIDFTKYISVSLKTKKLGITETENKKETLISSIRVSSVKIDKMMNLISELVTKQAELSILASESQNTQLQEVVESIESISRDLRDNAFGISLVPIEKSVLRFQRLVRDVSAKFGKQVNFIVEGKETELDKTIIEKIVDPIMHILRNSIDHGIESPEVRKKLGKPESGTITLKAYPSGVHVVIEISDDGAGINLDKVRQTAVRKGFIGKNDELTTNDMLNLIISPGFSTAENISEVSGRGVGMDVVSQKIKEIRGDLEIDTEKNAGTTITIKLPLTISIIDSLLLTIGSTYYLVPLAVVERCAEVKLEEITGASNNYLILDGEFIPFIDLHSEFNIKEERSDIQRLILVHYRNFKVALVVDTIIGNYQAVLKSLGDAYKNQEIISGASILGNGEVALVMDTSKIIGAYMDTEKMELMRQKDTLATE